MSDRLSNGRQKAVAKLSILFYKTIGAQVGQPDGLQSAIAAFKTTDLAGEPITEASGEIRVFIANNWERQKVVEVRQNLPYPMSVLSMSVWTRVEGG